MSEALLVLAGIGAGRCGSVAGLASLVSDLADQGRRVGLLVAQTFAGGLLGAALLLSLPAEVFEAVVPGLVALGSVLLLARDRIRAWALRRDAARGMPGPRWTVLVFVFVVVADVDWTVALLLPSHRTTHESVPSREPSGHCLRATESATMAAMASRASNFCVDAVDPYAQVRWWSLVLDDFQLLDEAEMGPDVEECWLVGPDDREIIFARVPEPKTVKNRMHLCIRPTDRTREDEVERILALGATLVDDRRDGPDLGWAVLADPEGNEFCVLTRYSPKA